MNIVELEGKTREGLMDLARILGVSGYSTLKKQDLIFRLLQAEAEQQGNLFGSGILEIIGEGYGFLRQESLLPSPNDVYISQSQIRRFGLRTGSMVSGQMRPPKNGERYPSLLRVEAINGLDPELSKSRPHFSSLTPTFPDRLLDLEQSPHNLSTRLINMVAPIGRGQRGLIVSPPKAGKTILVSSP